MLTEVQSRSTGKERDTETGLDYFGARYYGSNMGRFMSPDPLLNSGHPADPQSWNRYSYVSNNPLRFTDPTGLFKWATNCDESSDSACKAERDRFRTALEETRKAMENLEEGSDEREALQQSLKRIGEEGKGDVKVAFGDAGETAGQPNLAITDGKTITFNLKAIDAAATAYGLNKGETATLDASLVGHEGSHLGRRIPFFGRNTLDERHGLFGQSATYQGLNSKDKLTNLWNPSWAKVDRSFREVQRREAIDRELARQEQQKAGEKKQ